MYFMEQCPYKQAANRPCCAEAPPDIYWPFTPSQPARHYCSPSRYVSPCQARACPKAADTGAMLCLAHGVKFPAATKYSWPSGSGLPLEPFSGAACGVDLRRRGHTAFIALPAGKSYCVALNLDLFGANRQPIAVEAALHRGNRLILVRNYTIEAGQSVLKDLLLAEATARGGDCCFSVRLLSPNAVRIREGFVSVAEII